MAPGTGRVLVWILCHSDYLTDSTEAGIMMKLEITRAVVIKTPGSADQIILYTDLPEATYPYTQRLDLTARAAKGTGVAYLEKHFFGVPIEVIR